MTVATHAKETFQVGPTTLHLLKGGSGRPLMFLHGIEGPEGWLEIHDRLANGATVYAPAHPGYGETERPDWIETNAHLALFYLWFLQEAGLDAIDLVGAGVGGWIAAEMAVMCPQVLRHLVLVDAAGVRPREAEILDVFVIPWREVIERSFYDPAASAEYERIYGATPIQDFGGPRENGRSMALLQSYLAYVNFAGDVQVTVAQLANGPTIVTTAVDPMAGVHVRGTAADGEVVLSYFAPAPFSGPTTAVRPQVLAARIVAKDVTGL